VSSLTNRRSLKNVSLTERFHFAYFGGWALFNLFLIVLDFALLTCAVQLMPEDLLSISSQRLVLYLGVCSVVLSGAVALLAALSAHRIAGVHLKLENVFNAVGDGDFATRLQFRSVDRLDDVADSFNEMVASIKLGEAPEPLDDGDNPNAKHREGERRSINSMARTRRHHIKYMGIWLLGSLELILVGYEAAATCLSLLSVTGGSPPHGALALKLILLVSIVATIYLAFVNAHRIAGVHIRFKETFQKIQAGERDLELRFRASDKLAPVEAAYQRMLEAIRARESVSPGEESDEQAGLI
jgi:methyl-accepting chemotaxis protein